MLLRLLVFSFFVFSTPTLWASSNCANSDQYSINPSVVSFMDLIAHPEVYDGTSIIVIGVISAEFEDTAIYSDVEAFEYFKQRSAVNIHLTSDQLSQAKRYAGEYVLVEGNIHMRARSLDYIADMDCIRRIHLVAKRPKGKSADRK